MNIEQTKEAIRIMQAFVDGRPIECAEVHKLNWGETLSPVWNWNNFTYRIKPTPTFRPWTADEVPLGCQLRSKSYHPDHRSMIIQSGNSMIREGWLNEYEHSTDGGKNWLPCGVMEEAK
jgi:hypothetical protein